MTATDELRRLLDERDVEYTVIPEDAYSREHFKIGSTEIWTNGRGEIAVYYLSPEQAVEATLGRGTCHNEGDSSDFCCSECGVRMYMETDDTYTMATDERVIELPTYCPNCGRKVVDA